MRLEMELARKSDVRRLRFSCFMIVCLSGFSPMANTAALASAEIAGDILSTEPTEPAGRFTEVFEDGLLAYDAHQYTRA